MCVCVCVCPFGCDVQVRTERGCFRYSKLWCLVTGCGQECARWDLLLLYQVIYTHKPPYRVCTHTHMHNHGDVFITCNCKCLLTHSYKYMEDVVARWDEMRILQQVVEHKLLFIETKDVVETTLALDNFKRACDSGRGAIFFSIARGKVSLLMFLLMFYLWMGKMADSWSLLSARCRHSLME
jgi:hypothetical protein